MLRWAIILFVLAVIFAVLGFGGLAGTLSTVAEVLFWVFIGLFVLSLIFGRRVFG